MKQSLILGTALAMALSVAPAMAGTMDMVKGANGTALSTAELSSVEGKMRKRPTIRVRNNSSVVQRNTCKKCFLVYQGNNNSVRQSASLKLVKINLNIRFGGKIRP